MGIIINDLPLTIPFAVYDVSKGHFLFSIMKPDDGGDVSPDIATLPVVGLRSVGSITIIDTVS